MPVGFRYDAGSDSIQIGGHNFGESKKFRDAGHNPRIAFVVDDLASTDPWRPRGIEIRGHAETFTEGGERLGSGFAGAWLQITPIRIISWGLDTNSFRTSSRSVS